MSIHFLIIFFEEPIYRSKLNYQKGRLEQEKCSSNTTDSQKSDSESFLVAPFARLEGGAGTSARHDVTGSWRR